MADGHRLVVGVLLQLGQRALERDGDEAGVAECEAIIAVTNDDETNIRKVLAAMIRRLGHQVQQAIDGGEAMALLKLHEISAVVTDLRMPRVDGMTLLKHVIALMRPRYSSGPSR